MVSKVGLKGSQRTIPLTKRMNVVLHAMERDARNAFASMRVPFTDPYILGTNETDSRPLHSTALTKEFKSFCKMHGFDCTFHDLRHTFATMMIANGTDVRTVASYLGHSNVAMTLNTYAEVDPQAKLAAVERVEESFDVDDSCYDVENPYGLVEPQGITLTFTMEQLETMLAEARRRKAASMDIPLPKN